MKLLVALAAGFVLGARSTQDLDEIVRSLRAIKDTEEFQDLVASVRSHAGHTLRELAALVEGVGSTDPDDESASTHDDLVERVRRLAGLR
jgi:hypothetical protein